MASKKETKWSLRRRIPVATPVPVAPSYTLTDLGALPGFTDSYAFAINIQGDVVGYVYNRQTMAEDAFLYRGGQLFDLGTLPTATKNRLFAVFYG